MDWTMIANAEGALGRIRTLYYLLKNRYDASPEYAAIKLNEEPGSNVLWKKLSIELKKEIEENQFDLGMGKVFTDSEARSYFREMIGAS